MVFYGLLGVLSCFLSVCIMGVQISNRMLSDCKSDKAIIRQGNMFLEVLMKTSFLFEANPHFLPIPTLFL